MNIESNRSIMITNSNLNNIFKPNYKIGKVYTNKNSMNDSIFNLFGGKLNHHTAIVFDIIYDKMYRMFNENDDSGYIHSSLKKRLDTNLADKHYYFQKFLTNLKLDFYVKVNNMLRDMSEKPDTIFYYSQDLSNFFRLGAKDFIENAFSIEFYCVYNNMLDQLDVSKSPFNHLLQLLKSHNFGSKFFEYLLKSIFKSRISGGWTDELFIDLESIFDNNERSVYLIKQWFLNCSDLSFNMAYPIKCFYNTIEDFKSIPKQLYYTNVAFPLEDIKPIQNVVFNKSSMSLSINLRNFFMVLFGHDARMCIGSYIPSSLYEMSSNSFFIGKGILNKNYYNKKEKIYKNKLIYTTTELFSMINLNSNDVTGRNTSHKRKSLNQALSRLDDEGIIKIDRVNSERLILSKVWNVEDLC